MKTRSGLIECRLWRCSSPPNNKQNAVGEKTQQRRKQQKLFKEVAFLNVCLHLLYVFFDANKIFVAGTETNACQ